MTEGVTSESPAAVAGGRSRRPQTSVLESSCPEGGSRGGESLDEEIAARDPAYANANSFVRQISDIREYFSIGPRLGSGYTASVYEATCRSTGHVVAIKEVEKKRQRLIAHDSYYRLIYSVLARLAPHRHLLLPPVLLLESTTHFYIVMQRCYGSDMIDYVLRNQPGGIPTSSCKRLLHQLLLGVSYLHSYNILHRDIKLDNLVFWQKEASPSHDAGQTCDLALVDFDMCLLLDKPDPFKNRLGSNEVSIVGTREYMAPECFRGQYSRASDLWSVGVILYVLIDGHFPFDVNGCSSKQRSSHMGDGSPVGGMQLATSKDSQDSAKGRRQTQQPSGFSSSRSIRRLLRQGVQFFPWVKARHPLAVDLVQRMLVFEPTARMQSAFEALQHPWLNPVPTPLSTVDPPVNEKTSQVYCQMVNAVTLQGRNPRCMQQQQQQQQNRANPPLTLNPPHTLLQQRHRLQQQLQKLKELQQQHKEQLHELQRRKQLQQRLLEQTHNGLRCMQRVACGPGPATGGTKLAARGTGGVDGAGLRVDANEAVVVATSSSPGRSFLVGARDGRQHLEFAIDPRGVTPDRQTQFLLSQHLGFQRQQQQQQKVLVQTQPSAPAPKTLPNVAAFVGSSDGLDSLRSAKTSESAVAESFENQRTLRQQQLVQSGVEGAKLTQSCMRHLLFSRHSEGLPLHEENTDALTNPMFQQRPSQASAQVGVQQSSQPLAYKQRRLTVPRDVSCASEERLLDPAEFLYDGSQSGRSTQTTRIPSSLPPSSLPGDFLCPSRQSLSPVRRSSFQEGTGVSTCLRKEPQSSSFVSTPGHCSVATTASQSKASTPSQEFLNPTQSDASFHESLLTQPASTNASAAFSPGAKLAYGDGAGVRTVPRANAASDGTFLAQLQHRLLLHHQGSGNQMQQPCVVLPQNNSLRRSRVAALHCSRGSSGGFAVPYVDASVDFASSVERRNSAETYALNAIVGNQVETVRCVGPPLLVSRRSVGSAC